MDIPGLLCGANGQPSMQSQKGSSSFYLGLFHIAPFSYVLCCLVLWAM